MAITVTEVTYGYLHLPHFGLCWPASPAGLAQRETVPVQSYRCTGQEEHTAQRVKSRDSEIQGHRIELIYCITDKI